MVTKEKKTVKLKLKFNDDSDFLNKIGRKLDDR